MPTTARPTPDAHTVRIHPGGASTSPEMLIVAAIAIAALYFGREVLIPLALVVLPLLLRQSDVEVQHERVGVRAQLGNDERHTLGHQAGYEGHVARQTVELGDNDVAWLLILLAGGAGNAINASFQSDAHTSIGASTAIFGAIGLLAVLALKYQLPQWRHGLRRWAPLAAGVMLLAFFGMGGERIDVGAHLAGFFVGCLMGGVFLAVGPPVVTHRRTGAYTLGAVALFLGAWLIALFHGSALVG